MLGENIKKARQSMNLKAIELAERVGIQSGYMSEIENNKKMPTVQVLQSIAKELHTTTSILLGEDCIYAGVDCGAMADSIKKELLNKIMRALQE